MVALAGCNVFGLDATATDSDGDGIPDEVDNCPLDSNVNQLDGNHDGIGNVCQCAQTGTDLDGDGLDDGCDDCIGPGPNGVDANNDGIDDGCEPCPSGHGEDRDADGIDDACDPCPLGPPHDEDGDGIADACDNCPSVANPDQANGDGDTLGDVCAIADKQATRTMDGFAFEDPTLWSGVVPGWTWVGDQLVAGGATPEKRRYSRLVVAGSPLVETRATFTDPGGVTIEVRSNGLTTCSLDSARMLTVTFTSSTGTGGTSFFDTAGPVSGTGRIRLRLFADSVAAGTLYCQGIDESGDAATAQLTNTGRPSGRVALVGGNGTSAFDYLLVTSQ